MVNNPKFSYSSLTNVFLFMCSMSVHNEFLPKNNLNNEVMGNLKYLIS